MAQHLTLKAAFYLGFEIMQGSRREDTSHKPKLGHKTNDKLKSKLAGGRPASTNRKKRLRL